MPRSEAIRTFVSNFLYDSFMVLDEGSSDKIIPANFFQIVYDNPEAVAFYANNFIASN